jgi:hypothetical protein
MPGSLSSEVAQLYNAILNGPSVQLTRYPTNAIGAALTGSGMTTGAYKYAAAGANQVALILAAANTGGLWIGGGQLNLLSAAVDENAILWIGRGTIPAATRAVELEWTAQQITAVGDYSMPTINVPIPLYVAPGVGIALDLANSSNADITARGSAFIYSGLGQ